jgi:hypothetical protein
MGGPARNLIAIDREEVDAVALDAIEPSGKRRTDRLARELEPDEIWKRLGGLDGVKRLESNSQVWSKWLPICSGRIPMRQQ